MSKLVSIIASAAALLWPAVQAGAADGVVLIDQAMVTASGGFPYVIKKPGSYRLDGNLSVTASDAIHIQSDDVTLDLAGFSITGPSEQTLATAISDNGTSHSGVSVRNGHVSSWGNGIDLSQCTGCSVQQVQIRRVIFSGIQMGKAALVSENIVIGPGSGAQAGNSPDFGNGISTGNNGLVIDNNVLNFGAGITVLLYSNVKGNNASTNVVGVTATCPSNLIGNIVVGEVDAGFGDTFTGCTRYDNNPGP
jgi:hypothetical protein